MRREQQQLPSPFSALECSSSAARLHLPPFISEACLEHLPLLTCLIRSPMRDLPLLPTTTVPLNQAPRGKCCIGNYVPSCSTRSAATAAHPSLIFPSQDRQQSPILNISIALKRLPAAPRDLHLKIGANLFVILLGDVGSDYKADFVVQIVFLGLFGLQQMHGEQRKGSSSCRSHIKYSIRSIFCAKNGEFGSDARMVEAGKGFISSLHLYLIFLKVHLGPMAPTRKAPQRPWIYQHRTIRTQVPPMLSDRSV
ncbi:hypothetical protein U9M48_042593 [Paspalum notatum var. saurae]|uniref:Uncharacterized protein n=1 Tax=Paspalum notatum var. saurae TaxID=547442 RepID=A0AAQ3UV46_PASNO